MTKTKSAEINPQVDDFDTFKVSFYSQFDGKKKRQVINLDGFFINALESIGVTKGDVPAWVQKQVDEWTAFDPKLPVTRQIKCLIMRSVISTFMQSK
jgi:hypothetical protein